MTAPDAEVHLKRPCPLESPLPRPPDVVFYTLHMPSSAVSEAVSFCNLDTLCPILAPCPRQGSTRLQRCNVYVRADHACARQWRVTLKDGVCHHRQWVTGGRGMGDRVVKVTEPTEAH